MAIDKFTLPAKAISFPKVQGMVQPVKDWLPIAVARVEAGESIEAVSADLAIQDLLVEQGNAVESKIPAQKNTTESFAAPYVPAFNTAVQTAFDATSRRVNQSALEGARSVEVALGAIPLSFYQNELRRELIPVLAEAYLAGASLGEAEVNNTAVRAAALKTLAAPFDWELDNDHAIAWADKYSAELVKGITKTTRDYLRTAITSALEDHSEAVNLTAAVMEILGDRARSEMIARTEAIRAVNHGQRDAWEEARLQGYLPVGARRRWTAAPGCCDECDELDGRETALDEPYFGGHDGPPAHPNCRCSEVLAV